MNAKTKLFIVLWIAGFIGILSFLLVDLNALIAHLPLPADVEVPDFTPAMKVLSLIQPTVLMSLAVFGGVMLGEKVGLHSPWAEAIANGESFWAALKPQIIPGILSGVAGGGAISLISLAASQSFSPELKLRLAEADKLLPIPTRFLYGGVTEELLLRWGFMTLLVWIAWRVFQKRQGKPKAIYVAGAILFSALLFGVGHLPIALMLFPPTLALIIFVIVANSIFGLIAGWLYWKKGLEAAVIAHIFAHVTMLTANYFRS